ncbi:CUB, FXa inhibition, and/or EGF CA domain containing protein, partial [Asbolus verrucosus]
MDECSTKNHGCAHKYIRIVDGYMHAYRIGFELESNATCSGILNISSGTIASAFFHKPYPLNIVCTWEIINLFRNRITTLKFTHFELKEDNFDRVEIFDKFGEQLKLRGTYCGKTPNLILAKSDVTRTVFSSDSSFPQLSKFVCCLRVVVATPRHGICITFESFNLDSHPSCIFDHDGSSAANLEKFCECGQTFTKRSGTFSSNETYINETCEWHIEADLDEKIVLNIVNLDIQKSPDCNSGYVEVRDGFWPNSPPLGKFCGEDKLDPVISTENKMLVSYVDKNPTGHRGFVASYEAICGKELFVYDELVLESPGYPENYPLDKKCVWKITVPENSNAVLTFQSFDLENDTNCRYDYLEVRDGLTEESNLIGVYCGNERPEIVSNSNHLLVKFVSDSSGAKTGFSAVITKNEMDECSTKNHGCAHECVNIVGGYRCACRIGFELEPNGKDCRETCGGILNVSSGTINSPRFSKMYPLNTVCIWEIVNLSEDTRLKLNFVHFDLEEDNSGECNFDRLEIFDKSDEKLKLRGIYCGKSLPDPIITKGNAVRIVFISDGSFARNGFALDFRAALDKCTINDGNCRHGCQNNFDSIECVCDKDASLQNGGRNCQNGCKHEIALPSGNISTPNYPDVYSVSENCEWFFITTPGHRIRITFESFNLKFHENCKYDYVTLYDGPSSENIFLGKFCGSNVLSPLISSGNEFYMTFRADSTKPTKGFKATYSSICGGILFADTEEKYLYSHATFGYTAYDSNTDCEWNITSDNMHQISLSFLTFHLERNQSDYVEIFKGMNSSAPSSGKFSGRTMHLLLPNVVRPFTNQKSGTFAPPSNLAPDGTYNNQTCEWRIIASTAEKIVLSLTNLNIQKSINCDSGYVEVRDGLWSNSLSLGKFCGEDKLIALTSSGNEILDQHQRFVAKYKMICGEDLFVNDEARLESLNYPEKYSFDKRCLWKITVPKYNKAVLKFHSFDLETDGKCLHDYLEVRYGLTEEKSLIGVYCGNTTPHEIISSTNHLWIKFVSDMSVEKKGFSAFVTVKSVRNNVDSNLHSSPTCGGEFRTSSGTTPFFPKMYPLNTVCFWEIINPYKDKVIKLKFTHFDLEEGNLNHHDKPCDFDRVEIFSRFDEAELKPQGVYCGNKAPDPIISKSNLVRIGFISDRGSVRNGFVIDFVVDLDKCAFSNGNCRHRCVNTLTSTKCICGYNLTLQNGGRDCQNDYKYEISSSF